MRYALPRFVGMAVLLLPLGACNTFYSYHAVTATVVDAETGAPLPDATVGVGYRAYLDLLRTTPNSSQAKTDATGQAVVKASDTEHPAYTDAWAKEYLPEERCLNMAKVSRLNFALYHDPKAKVVLVVPDGYRGRIDLSLEPASSIKPPAGQREFRFDVPPDGVLRIPGYGVLWASFPVDIQAVYRNGTVIPSTGYAGPDHDHEIALRRISSRGGDRDAECIKEAYVIGDAADANAVERAGAKK